MARRRRRKRGPPSSGETLVSGLLLTAVAAYLAKAAASTLTAEALNAGQPAVAAFVPWSVFALVMGLGVTPCWIAWRRRRIRIRHIQNLLSLSPGDFEEAVADLFRELGYRSVKRTGKAGDLAADIQCRDEAGRRVVIQCKRYALGRNVSSPDLQAFIGMATVHHKAEQAVFVTTAGFTQAARDLARHHGIVLYDGPTLATLVERVRTKYEKAPVPERGDATRSASQP